MQLPINPYGKAKKMAEDIILDFHENSNMAVMILRWVFLPVLKFQNSILSFFCFVFICSDIYLVYYQLYRL